MSKQHFKPQLALLSFLLTLILAISPLQAFAVTAFAASQGADASIKVEQKLEYDSKVTLPTSRFEYVLHPTDAANPMPEGTGADGDYHFSIGGAKTAKLTAMHFEKTGIYTYEVRQVISKEESGYTYDKEVYTVQIVVKNNAQGGLTAQVENPVNAAGEKEESISFTNTYVTPTQPETKGKDNNNNANKNNQAKRVKTGDNAAIGMWTMMAALSLGVIFILVIKRRRDDEKNEQYMQK